MDKEELRIVLMGRTGSGKSSTGNTILGKEVFKSQVSFSSITNTCERSEAIANGQKTVVVDTPGFFDTKVEQEVITREVSRCISMTTPGPHAFLFVIAIGRFTEEEIETVKVFIRLFGHGIENYITVVFTRADELEKPLDAYLSMAPPYLTNVLKNCGGRYVAIDNKKKTKGQLQDLLELINKTVEKNGGNSYTNVMYEENIKMLAEREKELKEEQAEEERKKIKEIEDKALKRYNKAARGHELKTRKLESEIESYRRQIEQNCENTEEIKRVFGMIEKLTEEKNKEGLYFQQKIQEMEKERKQEKENQINLITSQYAQQMETHLTKSTKELQALIHEMNVQKDQQKREHQVEMKYQQELQKEEAEMRRNQQEIQRKEEEMRRQTTGNWSQVKEEIEKLRKEKEGMLVIMDQMKAQQQQALEEIKQTSKKQEAEAKNQKSSGCRLM